MCAALHHVSRCKGSAKVLAKDAIFLSPHKFPGGPGTPGLLMVKKSLIKNHVPYIPGKETVYHVFMLDSEPHCFYCRGFTNCQCVREQICTVRLLTIFGVHEHRAGGGTVHYVNRQMHHYLENIEVGVPASKVSS